VDRRVASGSAGGTRSSRARESEETVGDKVTGPALCTAADNRKVAGGLERGWRSLGGEFSRVGRPGTVAARNKAVELALAKTAEGLRKPGGGAGERS